jgi:hypothetical protein
MKITCFYGYPPDMGHIYLKPPVFEHKVTESENDLFKHVNPDQVIIPYITNIPLAPFLDKITVSTNTYNDDLGKVFDIEYGNDMDEYGYFTGIELTLDHNRFIDLVKNQAFKVMRTQWRNMQFHLITLDHADNIFKPENIIYKLTDEEDFFVIVKLVEPENLGYLYNIDADQHVPIAIFKALISARDDLYPLEYLLKPEFVLIENM